MIKIYTILFPVIGENVTLNFIQFSIYCKHSYFLMFQNETASKTNNLIFIRNE